MGQKSSSPVSDARLRRALRTVANAIECHGEVYWPIFETLKADLDARKARRAQLAEFRKPSNKNATFVDEKVRQVQP